MVRKSGGARHGWAGRQLTAMRNYSASVCVQERLLNLRLRYSIDIRFLLGPRMSSQHDVAARKLSWPRVRTIAELLKVRPTCQILEASRTT